MLRGSRGTYLFCIVGLSLAACVAVPPPAGSPPGETRTVDELNAPPIAGERDSGGLLEPGIQVLAQDGGMSDAAVGHAIAAKLRANLVKPRGSYPKSAAVTLEALLTPRGAVLGARVARGSGYKPVDQAVLAALRRAEPLPVTQAMRDEDKSQRITLVFHPFQ